MKEVTTYLNFDGNCRQAMEFYKKCLGADLELMPFSDMPGGASTGAPAGAGDRIMHARLSKGSTLLMASDCMPGMPFQQGTNFSVCIACESKEEIQVIFAALSDNGAVTMPLQDQFWGSHFGMLKDQFGIHWMLNYEYPKKS